MEHLQIKNSWQLKYLLLLINEDHNATIYGFPHNTMVKMKFPGKISLKIRNLKFQKSETASHVNEKEENPEKLKTQNFKNPKLYFCLDHFRKFRKSLKGFKGDSRKE